MESSEKQNVSDFLTKKFINDLKAGLIPWRRSCTPEGVPFNPATQRAYLGINQLLLASLGYPVNNFLTFRQIKELNVNVKAGEKGHDIVTWDKADAQGEISKMFTNQVFNIHQCEEFLGEIAKPELPENPYLVCEAILSNIQNKPKIATSECQSYYDNFRDSIYLPLSNSFKDKDHYFFTLFAEIVMATGNEKRLNRREVSGQNVFDSLKHAQAELTAELGAWQLASLAGIKIAQPEQSLTYTSYWIEQLERDTNLAANAATNAQKAVNYLLNQSDFETMPKAVVELSETDVQVAKIAKMPYSKISGVNLPGYSTNYISARF